MWALGVVVARCCPVGRERGAQGGDRRTTAVASAGTAGAAANPQTPAALQQLSMQPTDYAVDRLLAPGPGRAHRPATPPPADRLRPRAPILQRRSPAPSRPTSNNPQLDARDRAWLASLVSQRTGLPQADAEKRVDEAFAELKAAEQKARDAADKARKAALVAAFLTAATLAVGCAAACAGAALGAHHRDERTLVVLFGSRRFW